MPGALERLAAFDPFGGAAVEAGGRRPGARPYLLMDVFTDVALHGNQLAVLADARGLGEEEMQRLARELNLSETVFVLPAQDGGDVGVRIFTPRTELPFAGHPVLGCAILVGLALDRASVTLETGIGPVAVEVAVRRDGALLGRMRQPVPSWRAYEHGDALLSAAGVERSGLPVEIYDNGPLHVYLALGSEQEVAQLDPDLRALAALGPIGVNCFAGSARRWKTRMFAPGLGVPEDPATGSAAGPLAVHLCRHGQVAFGEEIEIRQGAEIGRPSLLLATAHGRGEQIEAVTVAGGAVFVARGELWPGG